jgi:hypothetical protein
MVREIGSFYDFRDRTVVLVGAGGGQLVEYVRPARHVIAVDRDAVALDRLATRIRDAGWAERFTLLQQDLFAVRERGDVLVFEFCLHEIAEPARAIAHARTLAEEVVVLDHAPGSPWAWYAAEEELTAAAWRAVEAEHIQRQEDFAAEQRFADRAELAARLAKQGPVSLARVSTLAATGEVTLPMPYRAALLGSDPHRIERRG